MPGMTNSSDHKKVNTAIRLFSPMTFPTKENPSKSVRYSARWPWRIAMQYITKPAARTALIRLVRMLTNVLRIPPDPMELVRLFTRDSTTKIPRYSAVMPRELTWAVRSSSLASSFKRLRSTIAAIMQWASSSLFGEKPETAMKKTSCLRAVYHAFS